MQVSHESPLSLLETSRGYNDYDYCLVHLLPEYSQYHDFFAASKSLNRRVLLDNSIFELGEAFDPDELAKWISKLSPDEYIVPDVFDQSEKTMSNFESWRKTYSDLPGKTIGVVQGKTFQEMVDCYMFMTKNAGKVAFNFVCDYFRTKGYSLDPSATQWHRLMNGRQNFVSELIREGIWAWHKPHHLLGCTLPQEFAYYKKFGVFNIETIDTSNPVVAGMHNILYDEYGLQNKVTTKLVDILEEPVSKEKWNNIKFNLAKFRSINGLPANTPYQEPTYA